MKRVRERIRLRTKPKKPPRPLRQRDESFKGTFTEAFVRKTQPHSEGVQYWQPLDSDTSSKRSLGLAVSPLGRKTWRIIWYRDGKPHGKKIGHYSPDHPGHLSFSDAKNKALAFEPKKENVKAEAGTLRSEAEKWLIAYVDKKRLRSASEIRRQLVKYIYPKLGDMNILAIKRSIIAKFMDAMDDRHGAFQADSLLATLSMIFKWYALRNDDFNSPIIKGMRRSEYIARTRILDENEIRLIWVACGSDKLDPVFGALVRVCLLTGQRSRKLAALRWRDINSDGVWTVHKDEREKDHIGIVKLPKAVMDILKNVPSNDGNDFIFPATRNGGSFNSFGNRKLELDKLLDIPDWTIHDLRRTARSLLAEIGVSDHIAEKVIGHQLTGVHKIYNRHPYTKEKSEALEQLASHIAGIVDPTPPDTSNVIPFEGAAHQQKQG